MGDEVIPRPLQLFLDDTGVYTVSLDAKKSGPYFKGILTCDCEEYKKRKTTCVHVKWVQAHVDKDGVFRVKLGSVPDEEIEKAKDSVEAHRRMLAEYGEVVVL